jgi:hypothetical protein
MIERTNERSCVLDAAAYVAGINPGWLIQRIGHNGEENGFHTQEIMYALEGLFSFQMIERRPHKQNPETGAVTACSFGTETHEERFIRHLLQGDGVLLGVNQRLKEHAVSWKNQRIHDSATQTISVLLEQNSHNSSGHRVSESLFIPNRFLKMEPQK